MTDELTALGRRAVACKAWRWMPGMVTMHGERVVAVQEDAGWLQLAVCREPPHPARVMLNSWETCLPDLSDAATLGCLLALVREACGDPSLYVRLSDTTRQSDGVRAWEVLGWLDPSRSPDGRGGSWRGWGYASEAEALVAALEAAP